MKAIPFYLLVRQYAIDNGLKFWTVKQQNGAIGKYYNHLGKCILNDSRL